MRQFHTSLLGQTLELINRVIEGYFAWKKIYCFLGGVLNAVFGTNSTTDRDIH